MEGGRVVGVACNVKFTSVSGNEGIFAHKALSGEAEVKLPEDMVESFGKKLCPLLDECGSSRNFIGQIIKIFEQFMVDAAALHTEEEMDQLDKPQLPVTGKILFRVFDKLGSIAGHVIHDRPERGFDLLRE